MTRTIDWATPATAATASRTGTSTATEMHDEGETHDEGPADEDLGHAPATDPTRAHERRRHRPDAVRGEDEPEHERGVLEVACDVDGQGQDERRERDRDQPQNRIAAAQDGLVTT